jgi:glycerophosphoryl diester phosphodiesterase
MRLEQLPKPIIFAHRGASHYAPENTLVAFQLAFQQEADAIELDVKLTADGEVVVLHDQKVDRTTNGHGDIRKFSLAALQKLDAGSYFDPQYVGEKIPTLAEVFEVLGHDHFINIELTNYATPQDALVIRVVDLVLKFAMQGNILFSSFLSLNILRVKKALPEVPAALLASEGWGGRIARSNYGRRIAPYILHPNLADTHQKFVDKQHKYGRRVHVWTVNQADDMRKVIQWQADGFFTDDPLLARTILNEMQMDQGNNNHP